MALRIAIVSFTVAALVPCCGGVASGAKAKTKTKDPWDVPDASEESESPGIDALPAEGADERVEGSEAAPADMAAVIGQYEARHAMAQQNSQHAVMKQFMKNFARNMRLSVLRDSKGDMPEDQRQRLISKAEGAGDGGEDAMNPAEAPVAEENVEEPPPPRPRLPRRPRGAHMLNMAEARHARRKRHALLPEAEGIGFPPPPGMAPDPALMASEAPVASEAPAYDVPAQRDLAIMPAERPHPHRHHLRMLNVRPGEHSEPEEHQARKHASRELPPGVVRDEMGRAMPVLFAAPAHLKGDSCRTYAVGLITLCCLLVLSHVV